MTDKERDELYDEMADIECDIDSAIHWTLMAKDLPDGWEYTATNNGGWDIYNAEMGVTIAVEINEYF